MSSDLDQTLTEAATLLSRSGVFDRSDLVEVPAGYYEIGDAIARGGMGRISSARDLRSGRVVAIKEVLAEVFEVYPAEEREEVLARFCREAIITARLEHPSIVPVYEIGRFGDAPFFAMKRVSGDPLDNHINAAQSFSERLALLPKMAAVTEAIAYAHDRGVIHRDLKPTNVLVGEFGETLVIDWGLAKDIGAVEESRRADGAAETSIDETLEGSVIGTPQYMPPEQARGEPVDRRADVYSLGAMLYHMLAGEPPYPVKRKKGVNPIIDVLRRVRDEKPTPLAELAPEIPADLLSIVEKAMARDPDHRYDDAAGLAADLASFQRGQLVAVHDYSATELLRRWVRRHRAAVITASILLAALVSSAVWFAVINRRARQAAEAEKQTAEAAISRWVSMFEQRGRVELHRGDVATAALILAETYAQLPDDRGVATMLADAMRSIDPLLLSIRASDSPVYGVHLRDRDLLAVTESGQLLTFDPNTGERRHAQALEPAVMMLHISRDRQALVSARRVLLLDGTGKRLRSFEAENQIVTVAADRGGKYLVLASRDGAVEVFALETGERLGRRILDNGIVAPAQILIFAVAVSTEGHVLASATGAVTMWNDPQLTSVRWSATPREPLASADISVTGDRAVLGGTQGRTILVSTTDGSVIAILDGHAGAVAVNFDPTGQRVITWGDQTTRLWDASDGSLVTALSTWVMRTTAVALDPTGQVLAIGGDTGNIAVLDFKTGRVRNRLVGHGGAVRGLQFADDGKRLVSSGNDGVVKVWNAAPDLRDALLDLHRYAGILRADDRLLSYGVDRKIRLLDLEARRVIATLGEGPAAMSADKSLIATRGGVFSLRTGDPVARFELGEEVIGMAVSSRYVVGLDGGDTARIFDHHGVLVREVKVPGTRLVRASLTADDTTAVLSGMGAAYIIDLASGDVDRLVHQEGVHGLVNSHLTGDGKLVLNSTGAVTVWNLATRERVRAFTPGASIVVHHPRDEVMALSRDGRVDLYGPDGTVEALPITGHHRGSTVAFSDDGKWLLTSGPIVRIFELETKEVLIERDVGSAWASGAYIFGTDTLLTTSSEGLGFWKIPRERRAPEVISREVADKVPRAFRTGRGVVSRPARALDSQAAR